MALRNQPYMPLYIQDYLTDEKLNNCSWETQGIYIKILCVLHKMETYGAILLEQNVKQNVKQNDKQNAKQNFEFCLSFASHFASVLLKQIPAPKEVMENSLKELFYYKVLHFDGEKLYQKRMLKDGTISDIRSKSGKRGGESTVLLKQNVKQNFKQNFKQIPEDENEYNNNHEEIVKTKEVIFENEKFLTSDMAKIFFEKNPTDLPDNDDKKNCWSIAQKIEKAKGWESQSSLNGKMEVCLEEWNKILEFVGSDEFFKKFSLKNIDNQFSSIWKNYCQKNEPKKLNKNSESDKSIRGVEFVEDFKKVRLSDGSFFELGREQSEMAKFKEILPKDIWRGKPKY